MATFFDSFSAREIARISAHGRRVRLPEGWSPIWERTPADKAYIILDGSVSVRRGGTGRTIDWTLAASVAARRPIVLAGGLNPDNVADAIGCVRPHAIDVSSGVEAAPGVKDHGRLKQLFDSIREAEARQSPQRTQWTQR